MKNNTINILSVLVTSLSLVLAMSVAGAVGLTTTPSWAKEKRWEQQIVPQLVVGDAIHLQANGRNFLGLYTEANSERPRGAVILVHGGGIHPDWPLVIKPLRVNLPEHGWTTLSIQMPVLINDAKEEDYVPLFKEHSPARIKAAVDYLVEQGYDNIFLAGHSLGAAMASDYLARNRDERINAYIGIGMKGIARTDYPQLDNVFSLLQVRQPVLDIYGSQSNNDVLASVDRRIFAIKTRGIEPSKQVKIQGSDHYFETFEGKLLNVVDAYMASIVKKNNASVEQNK